MSKNEFTCDCNRIHHQLVEDTLAAMPQGAFFAQMAGFYKMLGDATRCKIIFALGQSELCVCDLANVLGMSKSSVSHQLSKMRTGGVVKCRREGKEVYYRLDDDHIAEIFSLTSTHLRRCHHEN